MSIFTNLFSNVFSSANETKVTTEFDDKTVTVKYSISDSAKVDISEFTSVREVIEAQASLGRVDLTTSFTVLENGKPVDLDSAPKSNAVYRINTNAGEAGSRN